MSRRLPTILAVALMLVLCRPMRAAQATSQPAAVTGEHVLRYVNQTIDWYRQLQTLDASPPVSSHEVLIRASARHNAREATRLAIQFARAEAAMLEANAASTQPATAAPAGSVNAARGRNLAQQAANVDQLVQQLHDQIAQLDRDRSAAPATSRPVLEARRENLVAQLNLATARRDVLHEYSGFISAAQAGDTAGLGAKVEELARTVPEVNASNTPTTAPSTDGSANTTAADASSGLLDNIRDLFTLTSDIAELRDLTNQTEKLTTENNALRAPVQANILDALHRVQTLTSATQPATNENIDAMANQRHEMEALTDQFKLLAAAGVPLGEQQVVLEQARLDLLSWRATLSREYERLVRNVLLHVGGVLAVLLLILLISHLWRRATFRYISDIRRRRQLLLIRRIVIAVLVTLVIIASVVNEFGSLATFAGLITAGIAVALQTVILSGVAYFFFIGRFGVRVGDRVTISGITGDVVEIGLFRLYMMELAGPKPDLHPTGRIVVFSNAVLFQPSAFYKQLPGADYVWHEVSFTLSPETDTRLAESRLMGAVQSVFGQYRETLQRQHDEAVEALHMPMETPQPRAHLRFVEAGLELVIRYPVELKRSSEIDDQITRKLLETVNAEPKLQLVSASKPTLQSAG